MPCTASSSSLRVAVLPDSFKGSATAEEIAGAIAAGVRSAADSWSADTGSAGSQPANLQVDVLPFADGGEGTLDAICSAWGVSPHTAAVSDALGRPVQARYAVSADRRTGVVEAAEANGLPRVSDVAPQPRRASTFGVGELVSAVLEQGCEEILLCIGGSATTDGGAGMIQALGARLLDAEGQELPPGGGALKDLDRIDLSGLDIRAQQVRWRIACDVTNPLLGPQGAAAVFGPQKGADQDDVAALDGALARLAEVLVSHSERDLREEPGMGAAGGMPAVLVALLGAEIVSGGALVAETLGAQQMLEAADLVLTGEGRLDSQSLSGKVVDTVRRLTPERTPVFVIAGSVEIGLEELDAAGITAAFSIASGPQTLEELSTSTAAKVQDAAAHLLRVWFSAWASPGA